jgi:Dolichyl-phosphate-mannose-protein mannosyltransferase
MRQVTTPVTESGPGAAGQRQSARALWWRATRWQAAAGGLRRHWLAAALLAAGLVLRILVQLAYRPALFYIDSARYLYNAGGMDPVGYKGPLRAILFLANFDAVAAVQHLLGLAMAVLLYLVLLRRGVPRWLAALAIAPVLLDAYQLQIEQMVMPDVWFEALIVAGLAILLWPPGRPGWRRVLAAGVVLGSAATVAQVAEALLVPAVIYLLVTGGSWRGGKWRQAIGKLAAMCGAFAAPILLYCTVSYLLSGAFYLSHTGVTSFYGRAAAAADCTTLRLPADERAMCPAPAQQAQGPDWLEYAPGSPIRPIYRNLPREQVDNEISDFNHRVLSQQPQRLLGAYLRDVVKPFALTRDGTLGDTPISRWQFQLRFPYNPPHESMAVVRSTIGEFGGGAPAVWHPVAAFLRAYQLDGGYTPGPLLGLCVLAGLAGSLSLLRRRGDPGARQLSQACLLFFLSGVAVLLVSDLFEFSWRYQLPALVTLVPAGALGISAVIRALRPAPPAPAQE